MIRKKINHKTNLIGVENFDGETIEEKMRRVMLTNEPISEGADLVFQERAEGVKPEYDIRTDRWELAATAKLSTSMPSLLYPNHGIVTGKQIGRAHV